MFLVTNENMGLCLYIVKALLPPGALQFELRQSVSTSERSIYHTQAGFDPPLVEGAEFTE